MQTRMRRVMMMCLAIVWMAFTCVSMSWAATITGTDPKGDPIQPVGVTISRSVCPPTESGYGSPAGAAMIQVRVGPAQRFGLGHWSQLYGCGGISAEMTLDQPERAEFFLGSDKPHGSGDLYVDPGCEIPGTNNTISWPRQRTIAHDPNMPNGFVQHWVSNYNPLPTWPSDLDALAVWASPAHLYHFDWGELRPDPELDTMLTEKPYLNVPEPTSDTIFLYRADQFVETDDGALSDCRGFFPGWNGRGDRLLTRLRPGRFTRPGFTPPAGNPNQSPPIDIRLSNLNPWDETVMAGLPVFFEPRRADAPAFSSHVNNAPHDRTVAQVTLDPLYEPHRAPYRIIGAGFGFPLVAGTLHTIHADLCVMDGDTCQAVPATSRGPEGGVSSATVPVYAIPVPEPGEDPWLDLSATWWGTLTLEEQGAQSGDATGVEMPHPKGFLSSLKDGTELQRLQQRVVWNLTHPANRPDLLQTQEPTIAPKPFSRVVPHARLNIADPGVYEVELAVKGEKGDLLMIDKVCVWVVQVDLDILKDPGVRHGKVIDDEEEENPGKILAMNFDDDDCDGNGYQHGEALVTSDKDDLDGVVKSAASAPECHLDDAFAGDNDLVALKLRPLSGPNAVWLAEHARFVLEFDETQIALWKHPAHPNLTLPTKLPEERLLSYDPEKAQQASFPVTEETTVWVEGRVPHGNIEGTQITMKLLIDDQPVAGVNDVVKVIVADPIFALFGYGASPTTWAYQSLTQDYLDREGSVWEPETIWTMKGIQQATRQPIYYSVAVCREQQKCEQWFKIGLQTDKSVIAFDGHSNFGLGPAFERTLIRHITDFMNAGRDMYETDPRQGGFTAIDWVEMSKTEGYTWFTTITDTEIPQAPKNYWVQFIPNVQKFPNSEDQKYNPLGYVPPGGSFRLYSGADECKDNLPSCQYPYFAPCKSMYGETENFSNLCHYVLPYGRHIVGDKAQILIVETGSEDIPKPSKLTYKALLMRSCNSGRHFIETFQHGVYLYTRDESQSSRATPLFIQRFIEGKTWKEIRSDLNNVEDEKVEDMYGGYNFTPIK